MRLKKRNRKAMPILFPLTSLTWAALPFREPEQAWVSCLDSSGVKAARLRQPKLRWTTLQFWLHYVQQPRQKSKLIAEAQMKGYTLGVGFMYTMQDFSSTKKQEKMPRSA